MASVPSPCSYLSFSSFDIFNPKDPSLANRITPDDLNCAVSAPNALIGSRSNGEGSSPASFGIANSTAMEEDGLLPYFTLLSFHVKPMQSPAPGTTISVAGYRHGNEEPLLWNVDFESAYHLPFLVKMKEYSGKPWEQLYRVDIYAEYGEDSLDWEFCMDDLEVFFVSKLENHRLGPAAIVVQT